MVRLASTQETQTGIVLGGGIAGLLAARVLTDYFSQVIIVERDEFPTSPQPRRGVPQSVHSHLLLAQGRYILEQLFPGIGEDLKRNGAIEIDLSEDGAVYGEQGWLSRHHSGMISYSCTRNLLAYLIQQRLAKNPRIQFFTHSQVIKLIKNSSNQQLEEILLKHQGQEITLKGQLFVDATGRNSKVPQWLTSLNYDPPEKTIVNPYVGYATRWYQIPENWQSDWVNLTIAPKKSECQRSGLIFTVEDNRWLVTLGSNGKDYPPKDEEEFLDFAKSLRHPIIYETIKSAEPLSPVYCYKGLYNRLYHYEKPNSLPDNLIIVGDGVCAFNPTYGKGMTVAGLSSLTLSQCLEEVYQDNSGTLKGFSQRFQQKLREAIQPSWEMVTNADLSWPDTEGETVNNPYELLRPYFENVAKLTREDLYIYNTFMEVFHMVKPATTLLDPSIAFRVVEKQVKNSPNVHQKPLLSSNSPIPPKKSSFQQMNQSLEHHFLTTNNVRLHYVTQGEGELMLFLHGFPEFWYSWRHQIPEFAKDYKVVAVDLRGYNDSDKPQGVDAYTLTELNRDIEGIIKGLGYDSCILVGHDFGGGLAWSFADAHPEQVKQLIVMNCPHPAKFTAELGNNPLQMLKSAYIALFQLPLLPEFLFQLDDYRFIAHALIDNVVDKTTFSPKDLDAYKDAAAKRGALTAMINYYRAMPQSLSNKGQWKQLSMPTLLIWGEQDNFLGKELTYNMEDYVENLQIHYIPDGSHWIQQEKPSEVNEVMRQFLTSS